MSVKKMINPTTTLLFYTVKQYGQILLQGMITCFS